jgi:hypothetical protein
MEWVNLACEIGLSDKARNAAIACLRETGLIVYKPENTEIIALTLAGIDSGDRLIRSKPKLTDPMPNSLEDIQYELDYWEIRLQEGQPESDWWHGVKARIEGLRHRESRFLPGISITNNAIGANSRINQNSIDQSTNAVSGTISGTAEHDPSLLHTGFRKRGETVSAMAFRPLKSFFPTADELLQQDLPTLGKALLAHLQSYKGQNTVYQHAGLNRGYFRAMLENRSIGLGPLPKEAEYHARQPMQAPPIGKKPDFSKERNSEGIQIPEEPPPFHSAFPAEGEDGSHRDLVRYIMCGHDQLLAYTTTRDGLP